MPPLCRHLWENLLPPAIPSAHSDPCIHLPLPMSVLPTGSPLGHWVFSPLHCLSEVSRTKDSQLSFSISGFLPLNHYCLWMCLFLHAGAHILFQCEPHCFLYQINPICGFSSDSQADDSQTDGQSKASSSELKTLLSSDLLITSALNASSHIKLTMFKSKCLPFSPPLSE